MCVCVQEEGSIIYAVGIGGYYLPELQAVASQPVCSHVFTLDKFSYITAILTEIQKSTCEGQQLPISRPASPLHPKPNRVIDV